MAPMVTETSPTLEVSLGSSPYAEYWLFFLAMGLAASIFIFFIFQAFRAAFSKKELRERKVGQWPVLILLVFLLAMPDLVSMAKEDRGVPELRARIYTAMATEPEFVSQTLQASEVARLKRATYLGPFADRTDLLAGYTVSYDGRRSLTLEVSNEEALNAKGALVAIMGTAIRDPQVTPVATSSAVTNEGYLSDLVPFLLLMVLIQVGMYAGREAYFHGRRPRKGLLLGVFTFVGLALLTSAIFQPIIHKEAARAHVAAHLDEWEATLNTTLTADDRKKLAGSKVDDLVELEHYYVASSWSGSLWVSKAKLKEEELIIKAKPLSKWGYSSI